MRLLKSTINEEFSLTNDIIDDIPPYAILSHTWGDDAQEVTFQDIQEGTGKNKTGYAKLQFCREQAKKDGLEYFWIDTCCIKQESDAELSAAINSMFHWYRNAAKCYVYLSDVSIGNNDQSQRGWEPDFQKSRWFTRGWTLQELLAPEFVEFFSCEGELLGDKIALGQQIHNITEIPIKALWGSLLSNFSVDERMSWTEKRETKRKEDKAYSLFGIFDVSLPVIYGEGKDKAFHRLKQQIHHDDHVLKDLLVTDPRDDKTRIQDTNGGLLRDSYCWILNHDDFRRWRNDPQSRLLWIKGNPGKGKTMLLCGIIDELEKSRNPLSYFFCQANDPDLNRAESVLRGLIYILIIKKPSLILHLRAKYDVAGKKLFQRNVWESLKAVLTCMLDDPSSDGVTLVIDALDECITGRPQLLDFLVQLSALSRAKWIVSSRNWRDIEEKLDNSICGVRVCLELNENSISAAVRSYIHEKVSQLAKQKRYDNKTKDMVEQHLISNADNTFLWVALACQELADSKVQNKRHTSAKLKSFPHGLDPLYGRMIEYINESTDTDLCKEILAIVSIVYRPITLKELKVFIEALKDDDDNELEETIRSCGSLLTVRKGVIYFVHQSAKDFLLNKALDQILPSGVAYQHYTIFSKSLETLSMTLRRDIYNLQVPGFSINQVSRPDPDPLAICRYSCIYWVDHLRDSASIQQTRDEGTIENFLRNKYLYWLEAVSLCQNMSDGVVSMAKLETFVQRRGASELLALVRDAYRFIMYHKQAIENSPLQAYVSALMFSPARSRIRSLFQREQPEWIAIKSSMRDEWGACLQTLEGHTSHVRSVAFSSDSSRLASASSDSTVKIWDASSGDCLQTLEGHTSGVESVAFSSDSSRLASASSDSTVKIWDTSSGNCLQTLKGHTSGVESVAFSPDSSRLASASWDGTVKIWDASSGDCLQTLKGHTSGVESVAFSPDSSRLASASLDYTVKIWDTSSGNCLQTLEGHTSHVRSVAFSSDSSRLASASLDRTVKIWDTSSGDCLQTLKGHPSGVESVAFSPDSSRLASASSDRTVKIWDASSGNCLQTLEGHTSGVESVAFSSDSSRLASASWDHTVKIWDTSSGNCLQTLEGHTSGVRSVAFSSDSSRLASASWDHTVKIWDTSSGDCLQTLKGHPSGVESVAFSPDSSRLASASWDHTVKIWDTSSGNCLQTLKGHPSHVESVAFSPDSSRLASASSDGTVKIWDASSGDCLQTLEGHTGSTYNVSFDTTGSCLYTELGAIVISASSTLSIRTNITKPRYQGAGLSSDKAWIVYNSEKVVWLPTEYRPSCSAISAETIGIGTGSGKVWICSVNPRNR